MKMESLLFNIDLKHDLDISNNEIDLMNHEVKAENLKKSNLEISIINSTIPNPHQIQISPINKTKDFKENNQFSFHFKENTKENEDDEILINEISVSDVPELD